MRLLALLPIVRVIQLSSNMASSPILFTLVHLGVGGAQKIGSLVMNALVEQGYDVAVCCYWREVEHV